MSHMAIKMELLTTEQAAAVIGITPRAVRYAKEHIGFVRLGKVLGFAPKDVQRYAAARRPRTVPEGNDGPAG